MTNIPATQYLRVSTERQEHSRDCQRANRTTRTGKRFRGVQNLPWRGQERIGNRAQGWIIATASGCRGWQAIL